MSDRGVCSVTCRAVNNGRVVSQGMSISVKLIFILEVFKASSLCLVLLYIPSYFGLFSVEF